VAPAATLPRLALTAALSLLAVLPARAEWNADPPPDLLDYLAAVRRFEAAGGAPESAALLSPAALDHVRLRLGLLAAAASSPQMRWAVVMHLTAGVRESLKGEAEAREANFALAEALLPLGAPRDEFAEAPERRALRRSVPLAVGYDLLRRQRPEEALPHLERALRLGGRDDPHTLLALGMAEERLASSPLALRGTGAGRTDLDARLELQRRELGTEASLRLERRRLLESAEAHLREALALDPGLVEARVRLGRVLSLEGRGERARREWTEALRARPAAPLSCLAHLFLGRDAGRPEDRAEAVAQLRQATRECPGAQSTHLALSVALRESGDRLGAAREARAALGLDPVAGDPWLRYGSEPRRGVAEMLAELCRQ